MYSPYEHEWNPIHKPQAPAEPEPNPATTAEEEVYEIQVKIHERAEDENQHLDPVAAFVSSLLQMVADTMEHLTPAQLQESVAMLRSLKAQDLFEESFWKELRSLVEYQVKQQVAFIERRLQGDYHTDPYGMDDEFVRAVRPFLSFFYRSWWRTTTHGVDNIPESGRALLVSNHSGVIPWDGAMIATAVYEEHVAARLVRNLYLHWFSTLPFVGTTLTSLGSVSGTPENAERLLLEDELVCTFPEGTKGVGKLFQDRYQLARFGRGGFVQTALRTRSPIIPVSVVGAEEIHPMLINAEPLAKMFGLPYFPITPTFPWLGPLGAIPLPTQWSITFGEPLTLDDYGPEDADDPLVIFMVCEKVRSTIQKTLDAKRQERQSVF
jgi:1-acyl-sn-glycerol-3-phosphate acyltransferase